MGIGDMPNWMIMGMLCLWPFHIYVALTGQQYLALDGYGIGAVVLQGGALIALFAACPIAVASKDTHWGIKVLCLPIGYPLVVSVTNLLPSLGCRL
jgi:hypothetical protein